MATATATTTTATATAAAIGTDTAIDIADASATAAAGVGWGWGTTGGCRAGMGRSGGVRLVRGGLWAWPGRTFGWVWMGGGA